MALYDIEYNGIRGQTIGVAVTERPSVPAPQPRGTFVEVAGRDGSLFVTDGTYDDISIPVSLNFIRAQEFWHDTYRHCKNWLTGSGILRQSDDAGWHYKVKQCAITSHERVTLMGGTLEATFVCNPFQYTDGGDAFMNVDQVLNNPYYKAQPVYKLEGYGTCELIVNDTTCNVEVSGITIIDTEKCLTYTQGVMSNTSIDCDYESLELITGLNEISVASGFTLTIAPNWRSL